MLCSSPANFILDPKMFLSDYVSGKQFAPSADTPDNSVSVKRKKLNWLHFSLFSTAAVPVKESFLSLRELCVSNMSCRYVTVWCASLQWQTNPFSCVLTPVSTGYFGILGIYYFCVGSINIILQASEQLIPHTLTDTEGETIMNYFYRLIPWCFVFESGNLINFFTRERGSPCEIRNLTNSQSNISCGETRRLLLKGFGFFRAFFFFFSLLAPKPRLENHGLLSPK